MTHPALRLQVRGGDSRMPAKEAGYMELRGATKDADCHKVKVSGGVSTERGCCNEYKPHSEKADEFECGQCRFVKLPAGSRHREPDAEES